jgi:hypothetical protein
MSVSFREPLNDTETGQSCDLWWNVKRRTISDTGRIIATCGWERRISVEMCGNFWGKVEEELAKHLALISSFSSMSSSHFGFGRIQTGQCVDGECIFTKETVSPILLKRNIKLEKSPA